MRVPKVNPRKMKQKQYCIGAKDGHALYQFVEDIGSKPPHRPCPGSHEYHIERRIHGMASVQSQRMQDLGGVMNLVKFPSKTNSVLKIVGDEKRKIRDDYRRYRHPDIRPNPPGQQWRHRHAKEREEPGEPCRMRLRWT